MKGDRFEVFKRRGLWYWHLEGAHYPYGPIARSGRGYETRHAATSAAKSAARAAARADGRIEVVQKPTVSPSN